MMEIDARRLSEFENQLNPAFPEQSGIPPEILGYGEISSTFCIPGIPDIAFKRMPPFTDQRAIDVYESIVDTYCSLLNDQCGIPVTDHAFFAVDNRFGEKILYVAQPRLDGDSIGNILLQQTDAKGVVPLIDTVAGHLIDVWRYNREKSDGIRIGIDGQISNWSLALSGEGGFSAVYFDITTPLLRIGGKEQLDTEIFLKSCPSFLVWLVRWQFLQEVLDRYYDIRLVLVDLLANFHKEGRAELIDCAIDRINRRLADADAGGKLLPLFRKEIDAYYKNDAFIWSLFLTLRRFDRFIKTRILSGRYNFILPGRITR